MADVASDLKTWSTTASSNSPSGGTSIGTGLDDNLREIQKVVRQDLATKGADIASASTTDLGAVAGLQHDITGTTTITSFGTVSAGIWKIIKFEGALTLTHNATSLILPGGANITTADGDVAIMVSEGSGNWRCASYTKAADPSATTSAEGLVELATAAETLTGTDSVRAVTPSGIASNSSLGAAGYYKLPGGLIVQWASVSTDVNGDATFNFSVTFPTACRVLLGNDINGDTFRTVTFGSITTSSAAVYTSASGVGVSSTATCVAIGH